MDKEALIAALIELGFESPKLRATKAICFNRDDLTLYVKAEIKKQPLVVHPEYADLLQSLLSIDGISWEKPSNGTFFYHNSNLRAFPKRVHTGKGETRFGLAFYVERPSALKEFLNLLNSYSGPSFEHDLEEIEASGLPETEKMELRKARIGQGTFRLSLIEEFDSKCAATNIDKLDLLIASHIKPWEISTNLERLDPQNGLLLIAQIDALFDKGYVSFEETGEIIISSELSEYEVDFFRLENISLNCEIERTRSEFLKFHRENILKK